MPTGNQRWAGSTAPPMYPANTPSGQATDRLGHDADQPYWAHWTFTDADNWASGLVVDIGTKIIKVECWTPAGDEVWIARGDMPVDPTTAVPNAGSYDLYNPGGAQLVMPIEPTTKLVLRTSSNAGDGPNGRVELWVYAGAYALL